MRVDRTCVFFSPTHTHTDTHIHVRRVKKHGRGGSIRVAKGTSLLTDAQPPFEAVAHAFCRSHRSDVSAPAEVTAVYEQWPTKTSPRQNTSIRHAPYASSRARDTVFDFECVETCCTKSIGKWWTPCYERYAQHKIVCFNIAYFESLLCACVRKVYVQILCATPCRSFRTAQTQTSITIS